MYKGRPFKRFYIASGMIITNQEDLKLYELEKVEMINKTKNFIINNIKKNNELLNKYLLLIDRINCRYFANSNNVFIEELIKNGFNEEQIDNLINENWNESVIEEYSKRKKLIENSRQRSLYLKRKFKKED